MREEDKEEQERKDLWKKDFFEKTPKELAENIKHISNGNPNTYLQNIEKALQWTEDIIVAENLEDKEIINVVDKIREFCRAIDSNYSNEQDIYNEFAFLVYDSPLQGDDNYSLGAGYINEIILLAATTVYDDKIRESLVAECQEISSKDYISIAPCFKTDEKKIEYLQNAINYASNEEELRIDDINFLISLIRNPDKKLIAESLLSSEQKAELEKLRKRDLIQQIKNAQQEGADLDIQLKNAMSNSKDR